VRVKPDPLYVRAEAAHLFVTAGLRAEVPRRAGLFHRYRWSSLLTTLGGGAPSLIPCVVFPVCGHRRTCSRFGKRPWSWACCKDAAASVRRHTGPPLPLRLTRVHSLGPHHHSRRGVFFYHCRGQPVTGLAPRAHGRTDELAQDRKNSTWRHRARRKCPPSRTAQRTFVLRLVRGHVAPREPSPGVTCGRTSARTLSSWCSGPSDREDDRVTHGVPPRRPGRTLAEATGTN
jgi:hypothetical protein